VSGYGYVGGLVGYSSLLPEYTLGVAVSSSFSTGNVSGNTNIGGLVGMNYKLIDTSYWDIGLSGMQNCYVNSKKSQDNIGCISTSNQASSYFGSGIPFVELGWDTNVWQSRTYNYPVLRWQGLLSAAEY